MANGNYAGGTGTASNPYLIEDQADLASIGQNPSSYFKIIKNITITSPLSQVPTFSGQLDGDGYKVINFSNPSFGWINVLQDAVLKNINFENPTLNLNRAGTNSLFAVSFNGTSVLDAINITGTVTINPVVNGAFSLYVGTIQNNTKIQNCNIYANNTITTYSALNNLFGTSSNNSSPTLLNCTNYLNVDASQNTSIAMSYHYASDCTNYGNFTVSTFTNTNPNIVGVGRICLRCANYGNLTIGVGNYSYSQLVVGISSSTATDCANYGTLTGYSVVGISNGKAVRCANYGLMKGHPTGSVSIGGISGTFVSNEDCFFAGNIELGSSSQQGYYGTPQSSSSYDTRLKVLDTSTITVVG